PSWWNPGAATARSSASSTSNIRPSTSTVFPPYSPARKECSSVMKRIGKTPPPTRLGGRELVALAARDPAAVVEACEQRYHDRLDAVAQKALEAGVQIIMLTGPSAAGKTTTAHKLADRIAAAGVRSAVMSLDDFFVGEGRYP